MAEEKIFTVPLRKVFNTQRTRRSKKAVNVVRDYLKKHMKSDSIKIGDSINKEIWKSGIQKPPRRVRIHAIKENDIVYSELIGIDIKTPSKEEAKKKDQKKKKKKEKIKEERKERKKMTIQEEMEEESGKDKRAKDRPSELEKPKEDKKEEPKRASEPQPK